MVTHDIKHAYDTALIYLAQEMLKRIIRWHRNRLERDGTLGMRRPQGRSGWQRRA
jgi:hypothetical protein